MTTRDILVRAHEEYERVNGRDYQITFSNGYSFILSFKSTNFKHLIGLQHLTDIEFLRDSPDRVYRAIRAGYITENTIRQSSMFGEIHERISDLCHLTELLQVGARAVHPFDRRLAHSSIQSDVLIYKEDDFSTYLTLACCRDRVATLCGTVMAVYAPESIMPEHTDRFIRGQSRSRITAIQEIPRASIQIVPPTHP